MTDELLSQKELAQRLKRSDHYVWAMKRAGFLMPGGRATLAEARRWLARNPKPTAKVFRSPVPLSSTQFRLHK